MVCAGCSEDRIPGSGQRTIRTFRQQMTFQDEYVGVYDSFMSMARPEGPVHPIISTIDISPPDEATIIIGGLAG